MPIKNKNKINSKILPGFTLIELLVVIAIIGLLSTIVMVATQGARQKSRDGRRVATLREIRTALELYYDDGNNAYPSDGDYSGQIDGTANDDIDEILAGYMKGAPKDPVNEGNYYLFYDGEYNCGGTSEVAVLYAKDMETEGFDNKGTVCTPTGETVEADYYVILGEASP